MKSSKGGKASGKSRGKLLRNKDKTGGEPSAKGGSEMVEPKGNSSSASSSASSVLKDPPTPKGGVTGFEEFWSSYPRKVGKPVAEKSYTKLVEADPGLPDAILAGVARWKQSHDWTKDDGAFIPHPSTFLNQRRWEDNPKIEKLSPPPKRQDVDVIDGVFPAWASERCGPQK